MKVLMFLLLLSYSNLLAQSNYPPSWQTITTGIDGISFSLPSLPNMVDSLSYRVYSLGNDSTICFQIVILKNLPTPTEPVYETIIEALSTKDNVEVTSADSIVYQGKICLEGSLSTPTPNGQNLSAYFRYFYYADKLLCFFISAPTSSIAELNTKKPQFFNSIEL
jgi:hypothetical protein